MISAALLFARFTGLLKRVPWFVWAGLAIIAAAWLYGNHREAQGRFEGRTEMQPRIDAEIAAHVATKQSYRDAQEQAAKDQADAIAAEIAKQETINAQTREDYSRRLAAIGSRADRLRGEAIGAGAGGSPDIVRMPAESEAPRRADGTPDCEAVFAGYVVLAFPTLDTRILCGEIAEKQALDHDALIAWVKQSGE